MKPFIKFRKFGNAFSKRPAGPAPPGQAGPALPGPVWLARLAWLALVLGSWPRANPRDWSPQNSSEDNSTPQVSSSVAPLAALMPREAWSNVVLAQECLNSAAPQKGLMPHDCAISNPRPSPIVA